MYISFDFRCQDCGSIESRFVRRSEMDGQAHGCRRVDQRTLGPMVRLPAGTRTTFRHADRRLKR